MNFLLLEKPDNNLTFEMNISSNFSDKGARFNGYNIKLFMIFKIYNFLIHFY